MSTQLIKMDDYEEENSIDTISSKTFATENNFSQYFKLVEGWLPTTKTISILPSGIYDVSWDLNHQNLLFMPQEINKDRIVEFNNSISSEILKEIELFWTKQDIFKKSGFVYKRGILLYGIPGTGKTSTVNLIIEKILKKNGIVLTNSVRIRSFISMLKRLRSIEPNRPVLIIFEDIDKVLESPSQLDGEASSILQLLDGNEQIDNVVYIATTNAPEVLEKHIFNRPSRFDLVVKIPLPDKKQRKEYFNSFDVLNEEELEKWSEDTKDLTIAHLKELFISVKLFNMDYKTILERLFKMSIQPKQDNKGTIGLNV